MVADTMMGVTLPPMIVVNTLESMMVVNSYWLIVLIISLIDMVNDGD